MMRRLLPFLLVPVAAALAWQFTRIEDQTLTPLAVPERPAKALPGDAIFKQPTLLNFKLELSKEAMDALRREPRKYTSATVTIDGQVITNVAIHLKGAAGSFRNVDDRPSFTVSFSKYAEGRRWVGLRKIHLNNSPQDNTYLNEYLAGELFRAANVPATRVAWATVQLNDRKLGLFVLKEGFTEDFLQCHFKQTDGNLYDGGFVSDVDQALELDTGKGVKDRSDLKALAAAAQERDPARRWERLQQTLDVPRFADYAALSVMVTDWDGYAINRNNYRLYFNPANGRAIFMPHGQDQLFQRAEMGIFTGFNGMVARAFMDCPEGRKLYEKRFQTLFNEVLLFDRLTNAIARVTDVLRPVEPDIDERARRLTRQIAARIAYLERQPQIEAVSSKPKPAVRATPWAQRAQPASNGATATAKPAPALIPLTNWKPEPVGNAKLQQTDADGRRVLQIVANGESSGSWRATQRLKPGRYRLEARVRGTDIQAINDDKGTGAGLRISGATQTRANKLTGTSGWKLMAYEFEVLDQERDVTCICELRARKGQAQFELNSIRLVPQSQ